MTVRLTARDKALLTALSRFRIARSSDLIRLGFPRTRRDGAQRRLRKLFDAGLITVHLRGLNDENLYALTRKGRELLGVQESARGRIPKKGLNHHLAVVSTWVDIALGVGKHTAMRLDSFQPERVLREQFGRQGHPVIPDALVQLCLHHPQGNHRVLRVALEVDLGTEHRPTLERKFRAYENIRQSVPELFGPGELVLAVCARGATDRRLARVRTLLASRYAGQRWLWRTAAELDGILDRLHPPLTPSPNGKGNETAGNAQSHRDFGPRPFGESRTSTRCTSRGVVGT